MRTQIKVEKVISGNSSGVLILGTRVDNGQKVQVPITFDDIKNLIYSNNDEDRCPQLSESIDMIMKKFSEELMKRQTPINLEIND